MADIITIPTSLVSKVDLSRVLRELETLNESLSQADLRAHTVTHKPVSSQALADVAQAYNCQLQHTADRQSLLTQLQNLQKKAPLLHISFASDPQPAFMGKLVTWLRREIHPEILLHIGLQPSIAAGCIVRTTNKYFDFSLRKDLSQKREVLLEKMRSTQT